MNLIIDIGNTATKLAVFQSNKIIQVQTVATTNMVVGVEELLEKFISIKQGLLSSVKMIDNLDLERLQKLLPIKTLEVSFQLPFTFVKISLFLGWLVYQKSSFLLW